MLAQFFVCIDHLLVYVFGSQIPSHFLPSLSAILIIYLIWRLWRFQFLPALHPDEPRELPYLIPC